MNERVKDEHHSARVVPVTGSTGEAKHLDSLGVDVRIDPPHALSIEAETRTIEWQDLEHFVPARPSQPVASSNLPDATSIDSQILQLDDWGQTARRLHSQIQSQKASLEQREQDLRLRLSRIDEEEQHFRKMVAEGQSQLDTRKTQVQKNESDLAKRLIDFELQARKFEADRENVNQQRAEFERRRQSLREEILAEMHSDRNEIELARVSLKKDLDHAQILKEALQSRLDTLAQENQRTIQSEREVLWKSLTDEWEQRNLAFEQQKEAWTSFRDLEKSEIDREKAMFESGVESANAEFVKARESLAIELTELREHETNQLDVQKHEWEQKRQLEEAEFVARSEALQTEILNARTALSLEIETLREQNATTLLAERSEWEQARRREESELLALREDTAFEIAASHEKHTTALQAERAEWEAIRKKEKLAHDEEQSMLLAARESLKHELLSSRERHDATLAAEQNEWEQFCDREKSRMEAQQAEWLASRDSMLHASREALEVEFIGLREQHSAKLNADRDEWEDTVRREKVQIEERQAEMIREKTLIENRIRFQQDHLDKSRADFEKAQNDYRRERQLELQRLEESGMLMVRRVRQIDLYRSSIDAREKSLDREHEVFNKTKKALTSTADLDRMNLQAERHAWEQERQNQQNDIRRQQEVIATRAEALESRRTRLDKLRAELEETHRATLEMRLALEEAWAQLTHVAGQDEARQRVDQVRQSLVGYYQQMHESLAEQRREHVEAQSKFERQRAEFADERQKLTGWLTTRDEELRLGEERLRIAAIESAASHSKWLTARDRWLLEKTEAEQLIRRLLASLGENNREQSNELGAIHLLDEMNFRHDDAFAPRP